MPRWLLFALAIVSWSAAVDAQADERPNFVFFFIDDLGWRDVGFTGSKFYETPHIDKLAAEGMVFTSAYSCGPNCAPSRACLMTGLYSPRHGIYTVGDPKRGHHRFRRLQPAPNQTVLADRFVTLAEALQQDGYVTASMGKWHLGPDPKSQGFDVNVGGNKSGSPRGGYFSPYRNPQLPNGPAGEYLTDRLTNEAVTFLESSRDKPFFLYLTHYAVHTPIQAKQDLIKRYRQKEPANGQSNATYAAMVHSVDESVGRVLAKLEQLKLREKTVVCFCSDNGGYGPATSMKPLRGSKGMLYEGGIRVPMAIRWPGKVKPASKSHVPVIHVDFYPTFLEMAGITPAAERRLDGESLMPLLTQHGSLQRKFLYWHFPAYLQSYRGVQGPFRTTPAGAIRQGDWKLIEFFEDGRRELYNTKDDIAEKRNLIDKHPEVAEQLYKEMTAWRQHASSAPVPTEKNPQFDPNAKWQPRKKRKRQKLF